ncbi:hypothetical protein L6164_001659 [Bauhinia variegata]|uniref:Uncharacterized protein n=1 Tax=Bauhinia variegata TaxID=167791 RepID=A0ACB9QA62_BAUVA|nr:hypothetical protein L6164_001659 [Bauhinia variegata]
MQQELHQFPKFNKDPTLQAMRNNLLLVSSFLAFHFFTLLAQARDLDPYYCYSSCGDIKEIRYPFHLRGQPSSCGDPDYSLSCENNKAILEFGAGKYYVKSINYQTQRIRVVDANFANGICSLPMQPIRSYEVQGDIRYRGLVSNEEIGFVNCSKPINDTGFIRIPCMSTQNGSITYALFGSQMYHEYEQICSYPLLSVVLSAYYDFNAKQPSSLEDIQRLLQGGFDLGWSVECRDCIRSGRECSVYNATKPYHVCRRPDQELRDVTKIHILFVAGIICGILLAAALVYLLCRCIVKRKAAKARDKLYQSLNLKKYTYNEITSMTGNFADKLREDEFPNAS